MPNNKTSDNRIASLKAQDSEYNENYRKWRVDHKKDYGFFFAGNNDEITYRDGEGYITEYPAASERGYTREVCSVLANSVLLFFAVEIIVIVLLSGYLLRVVNGVKLHQGLIVTGDNEALSVLISYIINIAVFMAPILYLLIRMKMPVKVAVPVRITNKPLFFISGPAALLIFSLITSLVSIQNEILGRIIEFKEDVLWIPRSPAACFFYVLLYVVIVPLMTELFCRGILMQTFKQFGDDYALIMTSVVGAVISCRVDMFLYYLCIGLVLGYFALRTGSVLTSWVMNVLLTGLRYGIRIIELRSADLNSYFILREGIMMILLAVGLAAVIAFLKKRSDKISLPMYSMYIPTHEKLIIAFTIPSAFIAFVGYILCIMFGELML